MRPVPINHLGMHAIDQSIGLGVIGYGMASHLRKKFGYDIIIHIYDIAPAVSQRLIDEFGSHGSIEVASSSLDLANKCKTEISNLLMGKHFRDVYTIGDYCVLKAEKNTDRLVIDCSTV